MKNTTRLILLSALAMFTSFVFANDIKTFSLTVKVEGLRNSEGRVQFALYNKNDTIPDEEYKKYYKIKTVNITNGSSYTVFEGLSEGRYAVNVLHDENMNGKIDKGFILPVEGIGFTNFTSIGLMNQPDFIKASFNVIADKKIIVTIIYL
ncbi:MAG: DUF2141 domain-containing protein [Gammaproteobacteria bacterium]|nr:DUF2141 domain-containing protein [Gammaproteobacteria bacterium]MCW9031830.1 DUF2141 domain-containing protein [Gammaproteobacteria bacterium]